MRDRPPAAGLARAGPGPGPGPGQKSNIRSDGIIRTDFLLCNLLKLPHYPLTLIQRERIVL